MFSYTQQQIPIIFLVTDGAVEDERHICDVLKCYLMQNQMICPRLYTFGIGMYPEEALRPPKLPHIPIFGRGDALIYNFNLTNICSKILLIYIMIFFISSSFLWMRPSSIRAWFCRLCECFEHVTTNFTSASH